VGRNSNLVTTSHVATREFDGFGDVALEVDSERMTVGECGDLTFEVSR
jgi:hypothetical protein